MSTSLVVFDTDTVAFKYTMAMVFFRVDMAAIDRGIDLEIACNPKAMNMYIDEAIRLMH